MNTVFIVDKEMDGYAPVWVSYEDNTFSYETLKDYSEFYDCNLKQYSITDLRNFTPLDPTDFIECSKTNMTVNCKMLRTFRSQFDCPYGVIDWNSFYKCFILSPDYKGLKYLGGRKAQRSEALSYTD